MTAMDISGLLESTGAQSLIDVSRVAYFEEALFEVTNDVPSPPSGDERQPNLASVLERLAFDAPSRADRKRLGESAFLCRRTSPISLETPLQEALHLFHLCADGLMAEKHAELAMLLRQTDLDRVLTPSHVDSWQDELLHRIAAAFILLCRKSGGWDDVRAAAEHVHRLRSLQQQRERPYLEDIGAVEPEDPGAAEPIVARLLVLYNLAKAVDVVAGFLIEGLPADPLIQLDRFSGQAGRLLSLHPESTLTAFADALRIGGELLVRSSVWFNTRQLGVRFREFVNEIAGTHRDAPILELWPSQREALSQNLLNPAKRAIVVEMPTSAGKTLIAEFAIIQALALDPKACVAYVVPTRALVNQITTRLRNDFAPLGYQVEAAVPVFELDPTEDALLRQGVHIVVLTPEKLDLLLRVGHPAVEELSLVVADEAHNISQGKRGARLELLLGIIRREKPTARFLLLTPFVPNGEDLAAWLGEDPEGRIEVTWRPSERLTAAARWRKRRNGPYELHLLTLPSATNVDLHDEMELLISEVPHGLTKSKKGIAASAAAALAKRGGVLILERGRSYAEERAIEVADLLPDSEDDEFASMVAHFATTELGANHPLPDLLKKGVAFHHAGLSHDLRYLLEVLIENGTVKVVAGTTTLAQGVNFPIASVIVESLQKYVGPPNQWEQLSYAEFWNIAGRAGRALKDRLGLVVFPSTSPGDLADIRAFLQGEAAEISSALMAAIAELGGVAEAFNLQFVARHPAVSVFLQYLTHALRVAGQESATAEIEDILRSSFVYSQARQYDRALAEQLVLLSRRYLDEVRGKSAGYLALADGTGFSLSTVDMLYAVQRSEHRQFADASFWEPGRLFSGDLDGLTAVVSVLGDIPELDLGRAESGPFNPRLVAGILNDWVGGASVERIADQWFGHVEPAVERVRQASLYVYSKLVGQVPWGMGAVQRLALDAKATEAVGHIPSLVFYGVASREAAQLRMAGVPRVAAEGLADRWRASEVTAETFSDIRKWVGGRSEADWQAALPTGSPLSGGECRRVWTALTGMSTAAGAAH